MGNPFTVAVALIGFGPVPLMGYGQLSQEAAFRDLICRGKYDGDGLTLAERPPF